MSFPGLKPSLTENLVLPGGDFEGGDLELFKKQLAQDYPWMLIPTLHRYAEQYGTLCHLFLKNKTQLLEMGTDFGHGLYEAEVRYLIEQEWAGTAEAILWRRTKLGLWFSKEQVLGLEEFLDEQLPTV